MTADPLQIDIPIEYKDKLRLRERLDTRSDDEIVQGLRKYVPVTSERSVWCFWDSGLAGLPSWCRRNLIAWHRINGPDWTVRLLDAVPESANHFSKFVGEYLLPEALVGGKMHGAHVGPHSADLLRAATVSTHGGVWMDVGCILTRSLDRICWNILEDPGNEYELGIFWVDGASIGNHFVAGRKGSVFLEKHILFTHLWSSGRTSSAGLTSHPLLQFRFQMPPSKAADRGFNFPFGVDFTTILDYTAQIICWNRVAHLQEPFEGGFDGKKYWETKILKFDALKECWSAEKDISFIGQDLFDLLATRRDVDPESEAYQKAHRVVWRLLADTCMQKVTHGKNLLRTPALGTLWDLPENEAKDIEEGTFAELLRYGSVHFEQTRERVDVVELEQRDFVIRKGLLEP